MNGLNTILILLVAFVVVFLEAAFDGVRDVLGAQIDLLPILMVYASLSSSLVTFTSLAVLGGLWFDSLSANPLGITILPLFLVGYFIYARRSMILREQLFAQLVLGFLASSLMPLMTLLLLSITRQTPVLSWGYLWQWFVMSAGGTVLTPVFFRLFDWMNNSLNYRPVTETSFRLDRQIKRGRQ